MIERLQLVRGGAVGALSYFDLKKADGADS
jgi:hypothetical protein